MKPSIVITVELSFNHKSYLEQLAILHYGDIDLEFDDMLRKFIRVAPWAAWPPLTWREPPNSRATNTVTINSLVSADLNEYIETLIEEINTINRHTLDFTPITKKSFVYTSVFWWI